MMKKTLIAPSSSRRMVRTCVFVAVCLVSVSAFAAEDAERGAKAFQACVACHSLDPGRHLTGPSLANLFGRKAGTAPGFQRYSDALKGSAVVWNETTLDAWFRDPAKFIPGNEMTFPGVKAEQTRRDLVQYMKTADSDPRARPTGLRLPNLKKAPPEGTVKAIRKCGDTYFVTTGDGKLHKIWEFNLRLKIDTSVSGPASGKPVMVGTGMQGDRSAIVFAALREIGELVKEQCG